MEVAEADDEDCSGCGSGGSGDGDTSAATSAQTLKYVRAAAHASACAGIP